jgi:predicted nucleic acid-binding protein
VILIDTNVLVALVDEKDELHQTAKRHLRTLKGSPLVVTWAVLAESYFLLVRPFERQRLRFLLDSLGVGEAPAIARGAVLDWMEAYGEHEPDLADAELVVLTQSRGRKVWTYDSEFSTVWRRPDGTRVPVASGERLRARKGR